MVCPQNTRDFSPAVLELDSTAFLGFFNVILRESISRVLCHAVK